MTVVSHLFEIDAKIENEDDRGRTPFLWAAANGHKAVVELLFEKVAELEVKAETKPGYGETLFYWARRY